MVSRASFTNVDARRENASGEPEASRSEENGPAWGGLGGSCHGLAWEGRAVLTSRFLDSVPSFGAHLGPLEGREAILSTTMLPVSRGLAVACKSLHNAHECGMIAP